MSKEAALLAYVLRLADNALVLSQRLVEIVAAGPELEEELANANFALDYLGQARMLYSLAAELDGSGRDEDYFAYRREESEYRNVLLVEQPNGHFGDVLARQFLFETFYLHLLDALTRCSEARLAAIAARAVKEIRYHVGHNSRWVVRLGDGTDVSHRRMQESLQRHWRYVGEMFESDDIDKVMQDRFGGPDLEVIRLAWQNDVQTIAAEATLTVPDYAWMAQGGKRGVHSEHLGYLLAEMQYLQRSYPDATW